MTAAIISATTPTELAAAATLFRAYADALDIDLAYQDFTRELAALPGKYAPPRGALLLAVDGDGTALGCVALRPFGDGDACEMKRLYVAPAARGTGLGRALVAAIVGEARKTGYARMLLDTLPSMGAAQAMYGRAGFTVTAPYYATPVAGTIFMAIDLRSGRSAHTP